MKPHQLQSYGNLFRVTFREIHGAVIARVPGAVPPRRHRRFRVPLDKAIYENEENHQHFYWPIGDTVWERWQNNLTLACSVRDFWCLKLRESFPDRVFVLSILNELAVVYEPAPGMDEIEIHPCLRMWSACNDPDGEMARSFRVAEARPDQIDIRKDYQVTLVPECAIFTKSRKVRKSFLRTVARADDLGSRILL